MAVSVRHHARHESKARRAGRLRLHAIAGRARLGGRDAHLLGFATAIHEIFGLGRILFLAGKCYNTLNFDKGSINSLKG